MSVVAEVNYIMPPASSLGRKLRRMHHDTLAQCARECLGISLGSLLHQRRSHEVCYHQRMIKKTRLPLYLNACLTAIQSTSQEASPFPQAVAARVERESEETN
jgi:hypothetical protein